MAARSPQDIEAAVRSLVVAQPVSSGVEVSTPVAYPGGDLVNIVVEVQNGETLVHDGGAAALRLVQSGIVLNRHATARLIEHASRFHCVFSNARVMARPGAAPIELVVAMVANASRSVADYALEIRRHAEADFRATVASALRDIVGERLRENEEFKGASGRHYRVSAVVLDDRQDEPLCFVAPIANRASVSHGFAMLYDLRQKFDATLHEAIYDETGDLRDEDRSLLKSVGDVLTLEEAQSSLRSLIGLTVGHA